MQSQVETNKRFSAANIKALLRDNIIIVGIILISLAVGIARPNFFSSGNIRNLISNTAVRFIIAVGVSGCLITKGTDLSAGRMAGFAACLSAIFLQKGDYADKFYPNIGELPIVVVLLGVLGLCALIGAMNGTIISVFKVPPSLPRWACRRWYTACVWCTQALCPSAACAAITPSWPPAM